MGLLVTAAALSIGCVSVKREEPSTSTTTVSRTSAVVPAGSVTTTTY